ncbi:MAG: insulinase family protein [Candidatus Omnitrophica bacterium]|nr:insulinase family protein [Candidatus Omnitrophota bacterium]
MPNYKFIKKSNGIEEYELTANGLRILLAEDHSAPVATVMVTYQVGSRHENDRYRGSAHLLEHMMFKGTPAYNKQAQTSIASVLQQVGAMMNAGTWQDGTNYFELLPSDQLDLALSIEADRMRNSLIRQEDLKSEMPVVQSEFDRLDNSPLFALQHGVWEKAFQVHPYHFPIIGIRQHLEEMSAAGLKEFYDLYYWPNNAVLSIIGDFETKKILALIEKKFASISASPQAIPSLDLQEPEQKEKRFIEIKREDRVQAVELAYKTPPATDADIIALGLLGQILGDGKTSRLYRALIDRGLAVQVYSEASKTFDPGLFELLVILTPGVKHEEAEKELFRILDEIKKEGVTEEELTRAKNQLYAQMAFMRDGSFSMSNELSAAIAAGDWTLFTEYPQKIKSFTNADVLRVAQKYLIESTLTHGRLISKHPEKPNKTIPLKAQKPASSVVIVPDTEIPLEEILSLPSQEIPAGKKISQRAKVKKVGPVQVITVKTGVKDVVTLAGSFKGPGRVFAKNSRVADMAASMLDQGTKDMDKFEIAKLLEDRGAQVGFRLNHERVGFNARCLKKDVPLVLRLISEQLRYPDFDPEEFEKTKQNQRAGIYQAMSETAQQAAAALSREIYPPGHPHYELPFEKELENVEKVTLPDVREFFDTHYGPMEMTVVAVGDVDSETLEKSIETGFADWAVKKITSDYPHEILDRAAERKVIFVADKTKADVILGHGLSVTREDPVYFPLYLANGILGGDFSARLSNTVRDDQGLTYHIQSQLNGIEKKTQGHWEINMILNSKSLEAGIDAATAQTRLFIAEGITEKELEDEKSTLTGNFKVALATTGGLAGQILRAEELGLGLQYLDEFENLIQAVTLPQANQALRQYFHPDKLHIVIAGSIKEKKK